MRRSGLWRAWRTVVWRDVLSAFRRRVDAVTTVLFFVMVASLFPLGVGADPRVLQAVGPGVVWVAALLSCLLSLGRFFATDYADGVLEQFVLAPHPLSLLVLGKVLAHWVVSGFPLVLLSPFLGLLFGLTGETLEVLALALLIGTPTLSLIGAIGAALTLGVRGGHLLMALVVLPLFVPVLIFGTGAVISHMSALGAEANLSLLGACFLLALALAPVAAAAALRVSLES